MIYTINITANNPHTGHIYSENFGIFSSYDLAEEHLLSQEFRWKILDEVLAEDEDYIGITAVVKEYGEL